ncbi:MAG: CBS domain-containing protein [Deltaproteobacteria bacterium]|nr:CBS domain-containing protein [Deltaproteobacteria bacterium]
METHWLCALLALVLSLAAAAANAIRSSLLILGEEGLAEEEARGDARAGRLLAALRDPSTRHPFSLWALAVTLKAVSALAAGASAASFALAAGGWAGPAVAAAWLFAYLLFLFYLENGSTGDAMENPRRIFLWTGACLGALRAAVLPARLLDGLGRLLFGGRYSPEALMDIRIGSEEGILDVIEEGAEHGTIDATEEKMIEGVLRFGETTVAEGMTPWSEVVYIKEGSPRGEVASTVGETGYSRYPVLSHSGEEVVGILSSFVLLRLPADGRWEDLLERPMYVPGSMKVSDLLRRFQRAMVHMAVAIDEHGKLCGVITIHDLLEQIVGRLAGGADLQEGPEWEKDGALSVPAATPVRVLREEYGIGIPLGATYETAGGFVMDYLQHLPEGPVTFLAHGYRITVAETERYRIRRLRIEKTASTETP